MGLDGVTESTQFALMLRLVSRDVTNPKITFLKFTASTKNW